MPLEPGTPWKGLDTLRIVDERHGKIILDGMIISNMDIDPIHNRVTMIVSSDIGHDGSHELTHKEAHNG